ncbi:MAG: permease prefix domain 2-containing transporter [Gemmatimonadetes bacterium]|nr:permease prefix domain 2-containing transporter [Gemmatimonadota bacterium]
MTHAPQPPRRADALLERALPSGSKGLTILGDLHQEFYDIASRRGIRRARRWYWRESIMLGLRYAIARGSRGVEINEGEGGEVMSSLLADLKFGVRMLIRTPE